MECGGGLCTVDSSRLMVYWPIRLSSSSVTMVSFYFLINLPDFPKFSNLLAES